MVERGEGGETPRKVARTLLKTSVVSLSAGELYSLPGAVRSPVRTDSYRLMSYPAERLEVCAAWVELIRGRWPDAGLIVGISSASWAYAALVADELGLPLKCLGDGRMPEVPVAAGEGRSRVVVLDVTILGTSEAISAIRGLRLADADIQGMTTIFSYGAPRTAESFKNEGVEFRSLTNLSEVRRVAEEDRMFSAAELRRLDAGIQDLWRQLHTGGDPR